MSATVSAETGSAAHPGIQGGKGAAVPQRSAAGPDGEPRRGQRVGHYALLEELGHGGQGVVYRARDLKLKRDVALKRPSPQCAADPQSRGRFLREARAAAQLTHPHIVPIFEVFEDGGTPWIAMQLVEGSTLRRALEGNQRLPIAMLLEHAEGLADALRTAHGARLLHRDVKPDNILLSSDGRALLTDFGLARFFVPPEKVATVSTQSDEATAPGAAIGTPMYMAPEQVLGSAVDARSDIFAFGAVLYEMCTGRQAFGGTSGAQVVDSVLHRDPVPISRL